MKVVVNNVNAVLARIENNGSSNNASLLVMIMMMKMREAAYLIP